MIRIIAMIMILVSSSGVGYMYSRMIKVRVEELMEWRKGLLVIKNEINFALTPLGEAFAIGKKRTKGVISDFFNQLENALKKSNNTLDKMKDEEIAKMLEATCLKEKDIEAITSFIKNLGFSDKASQLSSIELYIKNLDIAIEEARENDEKNGKLFKTLGVLSGIFIVVIFI